MHDIWNPWHGCIKKAKAAATAICIFSTGSVAATAAGFTKSETILTIRCKRTGTGVTK